MKNNDLKISLILLGINLIGFYLWVNESYLNIPFDLGVDLSNSNLIVKFLGGLVLAIIAIIIVLIVFLYSLISFIGIFITPILVLVSLFTNGRMFGSNTNYNSSLTTNSYGKLDDFLNNPNRNYTQNDMEEIEEIAISKGILAFGKRGDYIDRKTGKFKQNFFFNLLSKESDESIDLETGKYQTKDFLGIKTDSGKKIDLETGQISKKTFFGYEKTDTRINQETGRIEKKGFLGWEKTDERINPDSGKKQKKDDLGIFWIDDD